MNQDLQLLVDVVGAQRFRPQTKDRREWLEQQGRYDVDEDTTMELYQAKQFSKAAEGDIFSTEFHGDGGDDALFEIIEKIQENWPDVDVRFSGQIGEYGYLDGMFLVYDDLPEPKQEDFEEYTVVKFRHRMPLDPDENKGICPICDPRIDARIEGHAIRDFDDNLFAMPDEFDFREYPDFGKCVRLWWDD